MKRILLATAIVLGIALMAAGVFAARMLSPEPIPGDVLALEDAMALPELIAIAHVDVAHASAIERTFVGALDPDALATGGSGVSQLWRHGLSPEDMIDHWVAAVAVGDAPGQVQAVTGDFPVADIRAALEPHYEIEDRDGRWFLTHEDVDSCVVSEAIAVDIRPSRVILGSPTLVALVAERLAAGAAAETDLSSWRAFREGQTASAALLLPDRIAEGIENPFARMAAARAGEGLEGVHAAYLGAAVSPWPPGAVMTAQLEAADSTWPADAAAGYAAWKRNFTGENAEMLPSVATLLDRLSVAAEGPALNASLYLDPGIRDEMGSVVEEGLQAAFGGGSMAMGMPGSGEEATMEAGELERFVASLDPESLPPADPEANVFAGPERQSPTGPFTVRIASRRVSERGGPVELEIGVDSGRIPNLQRNSLLDADTPALALAVTSVLDAGGRELLAPERCGRERNSLPAGLRAGSDMEYDGNEFVKVAPTWTGEKRVRLEPRATLEDVRQVAGHVAMRLPVRVETVRLDSFAGQVVERDGVRIVFAEGAADSLDSVSFDVRGEFDRLLAVRGLNAAGQYLRSTSGMASSHGMRPGKSVNQGFQGEVKSVELLLATEIAERRYPFRFDDIRPRFDSWTQDRPGAEVQERSAFRREIAGISLAEVCPADQHAVEAAPFRLCAGQAQAHWGGLNAPLHLYAPKARALEGNLSAIEIALDRVSIRDDDGTTHVVETAASHFAQPTPSWGKPTLDEQVWMRAALDQDGPQGEVVGLEGRVVHRLAKALHPLTIDLQNLGNEIEYSNGFGMRFVEVGGGRLHFELRGDRSAVVQLTVRDRQGELLPTRNVRLEAFDPKEGVMLAHMMGIASPSTGTEDAQDTEEADTRPIHLASIEVSAPEGRAPAQLEVLYALVMDEQTTHFQARLEARNDNLAGLQGAMQ